MNKTLIYGNRIAPQSINVGHFDKDIKIPEYYIELMNPTHSHANIDALNSIRSSNTKLVKTIDLKDIYLFMLEIIDCRPDGSSLKDTLDGKADNKTLQDLITDLNNVKGDYPTLTDSINSIVSKVQIIINKHMGETSHQELDALYTDVKDAIVGYKTLKDKLDSIGSGTGSGGTTSNITTLTPWTYYITLEENQTVIHLPNSYVLGHKNIQVFDGPILLYPGELNDYEETDTTTITLNYILPTGSELRIIGSEAGFLYEWVMYFTSSESMSLINFKDTYRPNMRELYIYEDGLLLIPGSDYEETNSNTITLLQQLPLGCNMAIFKRRY